MLAKVVRQQNEEDKKARARARKINSHVNNVKDMKYPEKMHANVRDKDEYEKESWIERIEMSECNLRLQMKKERKQIDENESNGRFKLEISKDLRERKNREKIVKAQVEWKSEDKNEEKKNEETKNEEEMVSLVSARKSRDTVCKLSIEDKIAKHDETTETNDIQYDRTEITEDKNLNKDWEIAEMPNGRYFLDFKSPYFTMNERIKIIEAALEDIRERYYDAKDEYNQFNRKCWKMKRKRRATGLK